MSFPPGHRSTTLYERIGEFAIIVLVVDLAPWEDAVARTATIGPAELSLADAVALLLTAHDGKLLVLWHNKYKFWTVPLGKVESGEPEINAARREAFEELGIVSDHIELLEAVYKPDYVDNYSGITIFLFRVLSYTGTLVNREPEKHDCLRFISPTEIPHLGPISFPTRFVFDFFQRTDAKRRGSPKKRQEGSARQNWHGRAAL